MATGNDVINGSLRKLGVLAVGATPSSDQTQAALDGLNILLSSWSYEALLLPYKQTENFTVTASINEQTMGNLANLNTPNKPVKIEAMFFRDSNNIDHVLKEITAKEFAAITSKGVTSGRPEAFYFEPTSPDNMTRAVIKFDRATNATMTLFITSLKEIATLVASTTQISLPGPWIRALTMNLAIDLAPEYGVAVNQELAMLAGDGKNMIKGLIQDLQIPENEG